MASPVSHCCVENLPEDQPPCPHEASAQLPAPEPEYDFVEQPSQDYYCPVTLELLRDPQQTTCCGHHISREAGTRLQREKKQCPMCNEVDFTTTADKYFKRKVNQLKVRCPHKGSGCGWVGDLLNLEQHANSCPKRPWQCEYCDFKATYEVYGDHVPLCTKYPIPCPNQCEIVTVPRSNLENHLSECPLQLVECEFSQTGCKEKVPRRDLASHVRENAQQHLLSMSLLNLTLTRELREKMEEKDRQIAELQEELKQQGKEIEQRDRQTHQQLQRMEQEGKQQVTQLQQQLQRMEQEGKQRLKEQGKQSQQQLKQLEQEHKQQNRETRQQLEHIQVHLHTKSSSWHDVVLSEFSIKKANNEDWYSDPFYSQGYKFSLNIMSNGDGSGQSTHVSAWFYLHKGEYDDTLHWPIVCDGQLQLLNQQGDHQDHATAFHMNLGKGHRGNYHDISHRFIAQSDLAPKYLRDDCLHFRLYITVTPE